MFVIQIWTMFEGKPHSLFMQVLVPPEKYSNELRSYQQRFGDVHRWTITAYEVARIVAP